MVEKASPFWGRYPLGYTEVAGKQKFWGSGYISDLHDEYISHDYFEPVAFINRFPNYKNKRVVDPQVKLFIDKIEIDYDKEWDLPVPNGAAAYKSLAKYGKSEVIMSVADVGKLNQAWTWMVRQFHPYMGDSVVLSLDEAVKRLDMSSSSGCPFNQLHPTKRELFEKDNDILQWLENDWEVLASDPLWTTIFSSSLKEELRPLQKIAENSQRTFAAGATDATVHGNRLFADMNEKMYDSHLKTASVIGMSPLKGNWHKLFEKLNVFPNGYALDETQYDSSLRSFLMWGCAKFRWQALRKDQQTPENFSRLRTYYRNLINTLMLTPDGILMFKKLGNPSGSVNTVTDNTLILYWMKAFAWIDNSPVEDCTYEMFEDHVSKALLGDDNTWTVSDHAHVYYNGLSVIESWKKLGIITTTDCYQPRIAADLDFLSAHTVFLDGYAVPLYDRNKLMQALLFAPQKHLTPETTMQRVTNLLQIGWTDLPFRRFCRGLIHWLLEEYDELLVNDPRWISAKCGIQDDETLFRLFTGQKPLVLRPQSYQETQERLIKLDKVDSMSALVVQRKTRRNRRGKQRQSRPQGKVIAKETVLVKRAPRRRNRSGRRTNVGKRGNALAGRGSTKNITTNRKSMPFEEDEYIGEVVIANTPGFNVTAYAVNPGQVATFPWLSTIASRFEKYQFDFLEFYFKREVSEFATAGTIGKVIMSFDTDASDPPPSGKQQMEAQDPHVDGMPCENQRLVIPPRMLKKFNDAHFVRPGVLPINADIKTYDIGNLFIATQGITADDGFAVGELHVRYRGRLMIPVLESVVHNAPPNNNISQFEDSGDEQDVPSGVETKIQFNSSVINGLGIGTNVPTDTFTLPSGNYLVWVTIQASYPAETVQVTLRLRGRDSAGSTYKQRTLLAPATAENTIIDMAYITYVTSNGANNFWIEVDPEFSAGTTCSVVGTIIFHGV